MLSVLALLGVAGFSLLMFYGLRLTDPVNAALIMAFNPAQTTVLSALLNREKIQRAQWLGIFIGLFGVIVVVSHGSLAALLGLHLSTGDLLVALSSLCWAAYCVLPKRFIKDIPSALMSSLTITLAAVVLIALALSNAPDSATVPAPGTLGVLLFLGIFGTALPYFWWNRSVQILGPAKASVFMNLVPLFASLIGVLLGSGLSHSQLVGAALIIGGVLINGRQTPAPATTNTCRPAPATLPSGG
ncbi:MAG: EamA family transporter [Burkholderiales bacterium]|nr:EamA family transporter [Burkholderiales bacterium]